MFRRPSSRSHDSTLWVPRIAEHSGTLRNIPDGPKTAPITRKQRFLVVPPSSAMFRFRSDTQARAKTPSGSASGRIRRMVYEGRTRTNSARNRTLDAALPRGCLYSNPPDDPRWCPICYPSPRPSPDGFHRVEAAVAAKIDKVECDVRQGTREDAQWFSFGANQ